jgi:5'-3' exonuclease
MILVDNSQVLFSNIFSSLKHTDNLDEDFCRHMVLNTYRMIRKQFRAKYGELIICDDSANCWRKDFFPHYKAARKKQQRKSSIDFDSIYKIMNTIRNEVREELPYITLKVDRLEADDIIAILCENYHQSENILIVSNDKDFQQLQRYPNVSQYSPMVKKFVECSNPQEFLIEHIIKGDVSDGIPNVLSDSDTFVVESKRQKPCGKKKISQIKENLEDESIQDNLERNQKLIDMTKIPNEYYSLVMNEYEEYDVPDRKNLLDYFIRNRLQNLMSSLGDF